jgi:signal transduction histidine kinase
MLGRLEGSAAQTESALRASRRFTADAGHELRTPLTSLSANLDTLARNPALPAAERARVLAEMAADERRLTALLDNLQALARGDAGVGDRTELVDLADVADAALADARRRHPATGFALAAPEAAPVQGAQDGLRMIVDNLLENAARHGGGHVEVGVAASNGSATLTVDDDGPGIPAKERERVLARFARGTSARGPGSGLGLAIVAQQTALHGGRVAIEEAPLGGARVRVELPTRGAERPPRTGAASP